MGSDPNIGPNAPGASNFKMYTWRDPLPCSYSGSFLVVVAQTLEEAKRLGAEKIDAANTYSYDPPREHHLMDLGEPDMVKDLPSAAFYEWSE